MVSELSSKLNIVEGQQHIFGFGLIDGSYRTIALPNPYCFVDGAALIVYPDKFANVIETDLVNLDGVPVLKYEGKTPKEIGNLRRWMEEKGLKSYEADIPFRRVLYKDCVFKVNYKDRECFIDVECDDSQGYKLAGSSPIKAVTVGWKGLMQTFIGGEKELLSNVHDFIEKCGKTILIGWNVKYDLETLIGRTKIYRGAFYHYLRNYVETIDLRELYKQQVKGLSRYSLEEVAEHEELGKKLYTNKKICQMTPDELYNRNRGDVELLMKLEEKYGLVKTQLALAEEINLPLEMLTPFQITDTLVLRRLRELGYVAPNSRNVKKAEMYHGAYVKEPVFGIHEHTKVIDVAGLYPQIVINEKVDVDGFKGEVLPYLVERFVKQKIECGKRGDKIGREVFKLLANACYGMFGYTGFRFYDREKAEHITRTGQKVIKTAIDYVEKKLKLDVLYSDTDSIFIKGGESLNIVEQLNNVLSGYEFKLEHDFDKLLLLKRATGSGGAKKRYVGLEKGKLFVRGLELRRGDWCSLTKTVMLDVVKQIFDGKKKDDIFEWLRTVKEKLYAGKYDDELIITKSVKKTYKVKTPQGVAFQKALQKGLVSKNDMEISYVWTSNGVEPYEAGKQYNFDYKYYWEKQIMKPIERLIQSLEEEKAVQARLM